MLVLVAMAGAASACGFPRYDVDGSGGRAGGGGDPASGGNRDRAFEEASGTVVMEAEHFTDSARGAAMDHAWSITSDCPVGVSAACVWATPDNGVILNDHADGPRVSYRVKLVTTGTYYVWARLRSPMDMSNSVHLGLDGEVPFTYGALGVTAPGADWAWVNQLDAMHTAPLQVFIGTAGTHSLDLYMREDGVYADKLMLTTDAKSAPVDAGPIESPYD